MLPLILFHYQWSASQPHVFFNCFYHNLPSALAPFQLHVASVTWSSSY